MLDTRGTKLLATAISLTAAGLVLGSPPPLLMGVLLLGGLLLELARLQTRLKPSAAPWTVAAELGPPQREASTASLSVRSHRVGQQVPLRLELTVASRFDGVDLWIEGWETTAGLQVATRTQGVVVRSGRPTWVDVQAIASAAAVHRVFGLRVRLTDPMGLVSAQCFLPCPCEVAALPRSLHLDLRRLTETRRRSARSSAGLRPDNVAGHGDELRELREHVSGDAFKHIAWKASARRGRLMVRSFERERSRALFAVLDTGATMRQGRLGDGPLDQGMDLVHSLAELAARQNLPFGAALADGAVHTRVRVCEGLAALQQTDRALLDVRRTVAEELAPLSDDALLNVVAAYLRAVERVDLDPGSGGGDDWVRFRQRTTMAALARLPDRERLPALRGREPSRRADLSILRRFCRAKDLALPYGDPLPAAVRAEGLALGIRAATRSRNGPFVIVVISDFRGLRASGEPIYAALAHARRAGHRALVIAMRDVEPSDAFDLIADADDIDTARGLAQADRAARVQLLTELDASCQRVGARFLADPSPDRVVAHWFACLKGVL